MLVGLAQGDSCTGEFITIQNPPWTPITIPAGCHVDEVWPLLPSDWPTGGLLDALRCRSVSALLRRQSVFSLVAMLANVPIDGWFPAKPLGRPNRRALVAPDPTDGKCGP
jgi:hypothetical protein